MAITDIQHSGHIGPLFGFFNNNSSSVDVCLFIVQPV